MFQHINHFNIFPHLPSVAAVAECRSRRRCTTEQPAVVAAADSIVVLDIRQVELQLLDTGTAAVVAAAASADSVVVAAALAAALAQMSHKRASIVGCAA